MPSTDSCTGLWWDMGWNQVLNEVSLDSSFKRTIPQHHIWPRIHLLGYGGYGPNFSLPGGRVLIFRDGQELETYIINEKGIKDMQEGNVMKSRHYEHDAHLAFVSVARHIRGWGPIQLSCFCQQKVRGLWQTIFLLYLTLVYKQIWLSISAVSLCHRDDSSSLSPNRSDGTEVFTLQMLWSPRSAHQNDFPSICWNFRLPHHIHFYLSCLSCLLG